jgi:hypothetical protein
MKIFSDWQPRQELREIRHVQTTETARGLQGKSSAATHNQITKTGKRRAKHSNLFTPPSRPFTTTDLLLLHIPDSLYVQS